MFAMFSLTLHLFMHYTGIQPETFFVIIHTTATCELSNKQTAVGCLSITKHVSTFL